VFKEIIEYMGVIYIERINGDFIWFNKRSISQNIACMLECFLVYEPLMMEVFAIDFDVLEISGSYH
jgi:hypothetical protein